MKRFGVVVLVLFFFTTGFLSGCTKTPEEIHGHDTRLFGQWKNQETSTDKLTFYSDGTYAVEEGEIGNWSTAAGGKMWMYETLYLYTLLENNSILTITQDSFTKTYNRI